MANLSQNLSVSSFVNSEQNLHRGFLGPFDDYATTQETLESKTIGPSHCLHTKAINRAVT
ncbi:hypothetical protein ACFSJQ_10395 [Vibrio olivae]